MKRRVATLRRYGLTPPDYARLLLAQDGKCAICKRVPTGRMLDVDHDHKSLAIRGLLCHRCNRGLGFFSPEASQRIAAYLITWSGYFVPKRKRRRVP